MYIDMYSCILIACGLIDWFIQIGLVSTIISQLVLKTIILINMWYT